MQYRLSLLFLFAVSLNQLANPLLAQSNSDYPEAFVDDQMFLDDIADKISLRVQFNLKVAVKLPSSLANETSQYSYKTGPLATTHCQMQNGYSSYTNISNDLVFNLSAVSSDLVRLCLRARTVESGVEQPLNKTTSYWWRRSVGRTTIIKEPVGISNTDTPIVRWMDAPEAVAYDLVVGSDQNCSSVIQQYHDLSTTFRLLEPLADGIYYACVFVKYIDGSSKPATNNGHHWEQRVGTVPQAFSIVLPSAISTTVTPIVAWQVSIGADSYNLIVSTTPDCSVIVQSYNGLTTTSQQLTALVDGVYYACVFAINARGSTPASNNGYAWQQVTAAPGAFAITAPAGTSTNPTPTVMWQHSTSATSYDLIVATDVSCGLVVASFTNLTTTSQTLSTLTDGFYFACVTAKNLFGSTPATNNGFSWKQVTQAPASFNIIAPTGLVEEATPIVEWQAAIGADSYDLVISSTPDCGNIVQSYNDLLVTSQELAAVAEGNYFTCVLAKNAFSSTAALNNGLSWTFDITPPGEFVITGPSSPVTTENTTITWESAADANSYSVILSTASDCSVEVRKEEGLSVTSLAVNLVVETTYYVCVSAFDTVGNERVASNNGFSFVFDAASALPHTIFVTSTEILFDATGFFPPLLFQVSSPEAADYLCTYLANEAGLLRQPWDTYSIVYKAIISTNTQNAFDRTDIAAGVFNTLGQPVAANKADLFDGSLNNPVLYDERGNEVITLNVFTGTTATGLGTGMNCENWFTPEGGNITIGHANATDGTWLDFTEVSCVEPARLYCISPVEIE